MSSQIRKNAAHLIALGLALGGSMLVSEAFADPPAPAAAQPNPASAASSAASPDNGMPSLGPDVRKDIETFASMQRDIERARLEAEKLSVEQRIQESKEKIGIGASQADVPELVGVYQTPRRSWAEFLVGQAILTASAGEWVTADWQVSKLLHNGVELTKRGGGTRTVLFGRRSATGSLGPQSALSLPSAGGADALGSSSPPIALPPAAPGPSR